MNTPRLLVSNVLVNSISVVQEQTQDVTRHIIACLIVGRNICAKAPLRPEPDKRSTIKHRSMRLKDAEGRHGVNKWTVHWAQMTQVMRLRRIPCSKLHEALKSLHSAGYYVSQHVLLYNKTVNNRFIGWGSDPVSIYQVAQQHDDQNLSAFNFVDWTQHVQFHQRKLDNIRDKMHDLIRSKRNVEEIWAELRANLDTELQKMMDEWWEYDVQPMVQEAISSVVVLKLPVYATSHVNGRELLGRKSYHHNQTLVDIARPIGLEQNSGRKEDDDSEIGSDISDSVLTECNTLVVGTRRSRSPGDT